METNPLWEDDLDPAFWASYMFNAQRPDNNLSIPAPMLDMLRAQVPESKSESTANYDMRSLQIMICSRQDRIEASIAAIQADVREMKDFASQMQEFLSKLKSNTEILKNMLEKLRRNMDVFAKTLYRLLSGNARQSSDSAIKNTDFQTE